MRIRLEIIAGPAKGRSIPLRDGETLRVGRTEWSDCVVPEDPGLEKVHFEIAAGRRQCRVRGVEGARITLRGKPVAEASLGDGDQFTAGGTTFVVRFAGGQTNLAGGGPAAEQEGAVSPAAPPASPPAPPPSLVALAEEAGLSAEAMEMLQGPGPAIGADDYIATLQQKGSLRDAVLFQARVLECRQSVWWAITCVRGALGSRGRPEESAALEAAEHWVVDPSEAHRRQAEAAAAGLKYEGPAAFAAMAAFWSGDNLAPEGLPKVDVPPGLAGRGVAAALLMAAPLGDPSRIAATLGEFIDTARSIVRAELPWPQEALGERPSPTAPQSPKN